MSIAKRPSTTLIIVSAICTTMLLNRLAIVAFVVPAIQSILNGLPVAVRILIVISYWVFWLSRLRYARHTTAYLVYLALISDVLLYLIGLGIRQNQESIVDAWVLLPLQIAAGILWITTLVMIKKLHNMGWIVVTSLLSGSFILGGFIPLLLDHNALRSLIWLIGIEITLVLYLIWAFRKGSFRNS